MGLDGDDRGEIMGAGGVTVAYAAWCNDRSAELIIDNPADARLILAAPEMETLLRRWLWAVEHETWGDMDATEARVILASIDQEKA